MSKHRSRHAIRIAGFAATLVAAITGHSAPAATLLGGDLSAFAVLGAETVTNVGPSAVVGSVGVATGTAITGFNTVAGVATNDSQVTNGLVHANTAVAQSRKISLRRPASALAALGSASFCHQTLPVPSCPPGFTPFRRERPTCPAC